MLIKYVQKSFFYHVIKVPAQTFMTTVKHRSSWGKVLYKKDFLKQKKHLYRNLFLNNFAELQPVTLPNARLWRRRVPVDFEKLLRTLF